MRSAGTNDNEETIHTRNISDACDGTAPSGVAMRDERRQGRSEPK
jgi:hypothetical protein